MSPPDPILNQPKFKGANMRLAANARSAETQRKKEKVAALLQSGSGAKEACRLAGVKYNTYERWRDRDREFANRLNAIRAGVKAALLAAGGVDDSDTDWTVFDARYWGHVYSAFQIEAMTELERTQPGDILMVHFPPDHGKTTMFENYANRRLARQPDFRIGCVSESRDIARKILGRVKARMEPDGPAPSYVAKYGPFAPQVGEGRKMAQPWGADYFSVYGKSRFDERDYNFNALGVRSSIVSARLDHLHGDDLQSTKTLNLTSGIIDWLRQDAFTRTGSWGINSIYGTRVGEDDVYERLAADVELDGILRVISLPAIVTDHVTGEVRPLWPERYTLEQLDRTRRRVGQEAWDRNYMQAPGASDTNRTFRDADIEGCLHPEISLKDRPPPDAVIYLTLDPALGGKNCVMALEPTPRGNLIIRGIRERSKLMRNEEVMGEVIDLFNVMKAARCRVTDLRIEAMNFQRGLSRDERLKKFGQDHGVRIDEHLTGINKYDEAIGLRSMASSMISGEIWIPWAGDEYTRREMGELVRQFKAWRPNISGKVLRQDRVMALWFGWILWQQRHKRVVPPADRARQFQTSALPFHPTDTGLLIPIGAR